jgi:hypothetical protein
MAKRKAKPASSEGTFGEPEHFDQSEYGADPFAGEQPSDEQQHVNGFDAPFAPTDADEQSGEK